MKILALAIVVATLFPSGKNSPLTTLPINATVEKSKDGIYTSDKPYNLTVVYFVPSDMKLNPDYKRRISEYLNYEQKYVAEWMQKWGYGNKTFGLRKTPKGEVEINVVYGKYPTSNYPYDVNSGSSFRMREEIESWFAANPTKKVDEHVFVLTAVNEFGKQAAPYYGLWNWAFGIDFPHMEIANMTVGGDLQKQSEWIGGNFHEMLHAIGLPHNGGLVSENRLYGSPIMSANGAGFITGKTYISSWECALLSIRQPFSSTIRTDWYQPAGSRITKLDARYDDATRKIIVSGKFTSNKKVLYVGFTNDTEGNSVITEGVSDYDSENWVVKPKQDNSFYTEMSVDEFKYRGDYTNLFRISLFHENGTREVHNYSYVMVNGKPDIQFGDKPMYDRTKWTATASSQQTSSGDGSPGALLDGNAGTGWHSRWSPNPTKLPQSFTIDMSEKLEVNRFTFVLRDSHSKMQNITIETSNDGQNWTELGKYTLKDRPGPAHIRIETSKFRYFKVTTTSSTGNTGLATCQEVSTYKD